MIQRTFILELNPVATLEVQHLASFIWRGNLGAQILDDPADLLDLLRPGGQRYGKGADGGDDDGPHGNAPETGNLWGRCAVTMRRNNGVKATVRPASRSA